MKPTRERVSELVGMIRRREFDDLSMADKILSLFSDDEKEPEPPEWEEEFHARFFRAYPQFECQKMPHLDEVKAFIKNKMQELFENFYGKGTNFEGVLSRDEIKRKWGLSFPGYIGG